MSVARLRSRMSDVPLTGDELLLNVADTICHTNTYTLFFFLSGNAVLYSYTLMFSLFTALLLR